MALLRIFRIVILLTFPFILIHCGSEPEEDFSPPVIDPPPMVSLPEVRSYLTTPSRTSEYALQSNAINTFDQNLENTIGITPNNTFQEIDGFGFALTGGSALHLNNMDPNERENTLNELFGDGEGELGLSFIRISLGASDLDSFVFSYNENASDLTHEEFSLGQDFDNLIPILKEILVINPDLKILASPWSAPQWMKDNGSSVGGSLLPEFYNSYAIYLRKYIESMDDEGIEISHLTVQNEPLNGFNNPSMLMSAEQQTEFIKDHLGPMFSSAGIQTKLIAYDHNPDVVDYPITVLADADASQYIDGSSFHLYAGDIQSLSSVRNRHPDKNIYFTEQWYSASGNFGDDLKWHIREVVIGSLRNWSRSVIEWNLSSDSNFDPHTIGGCEDCLGSVTINGNTVTRNTGYYVISHVSQLVKPGSVRVESNFINTLPNVAFITADNQVILLVLNDSDSRQRFNVNEGETSFSTALDAGAVATYTWEINE